MKNSTVAGFSLLLLIIVFGGCSLTNPAKNPAADVANTDSAQNSTTAQRTVDKQGETASSASPCRNRYNPVADRAIKTYKMSSGGDAKFVQKYVAGEAKFFEEMTIKGTTVKHKWECTAEGLIAANPRSMMNSENMQLEPKHISGVTLPKDSEIKVGKTWSTVYQATGESEVGNINSTVMLNNKVVALDDKVKVPAGTFKAAKIETVINVDMKLNGKNILTPPFKTVAWFAPEVGMIKNGLMTSGTGNVTMEYSGGN